MSANRMELLSLKRRPMLARKGHKLLRRFFALFDGYRAARGRLLRAMEDLAALSLAEQERSGLTRLMRVKELVRGH